MKPTAPPINASKRTFVPPPPELSGKVALNIVRAFTCMLALPFLFEVGAWFSPSKTNLLVGAVRCGTQWVLCHVLGEGNAALHLGPEDWLFPQAEVDRVVHEARAESPLHADLRALASKLKAAETHLLLVVIPGRLSIYPEQMRAGRYAGPVRVPEETKRLEELRAAGAEVLDMTDSLWNFSDRNKVFYARDSHWTPEAMKSMALALNKHVREKFPRLVSTETPIINATILELSDAGDLSRQLSPVWPEALFKEERCSLVSIQGVTTDANSPIVLHGNAFTQVYDDAQASFGQGKNPQAGFATQMGMLLGRALDVRGAPQPDESYEGKKLVICLVPMTELVP